MYAYSVIHSIETHTYVHVHGYQKYTTPVYMEHVLSLSKCYTQMVEMPTSADICFLLYTELEESVENQMNI